MKVDDASEIRESSAASVQDHRGSADAVSPHAPRKLTFSENAMLTVKVLAAAGLIGVLLWAIQVWTSGR